MGNDIEKMVKKFARNSGFGKKYSKHNKNNASKKVLGAAAIGVAGFVLKKVKDNPELIDKAKQGVNDFVNGNGNKKDNSSPNIDNVIDNLFKKK